MERIPEFTYIAPGTCHAQHSFLLVGHAAIEHRFLQHAQLLSPLTLRHKLGMALSGRDVRGPAGQRPALPTGLEKIRRIPC